MSQKLICSRHFTCQQPLSSLKVYILLFFFSLCSTEESVPAVEPNPVAGIEVMLVNKIQMFWGFFCFTFLWLCVFSQIFFSLNDRMLNTRLPLTRDFNLKLNNYWRGFLSRNQRPQCQTSMTSLFLELCVSWPKLYSVKFKRSF